MCELAKRVKIGLREAILQSKVNIVLGLFIRLDISAPGNVQIVRFIDCGLAQIGLYGTLKSTRVCSNVVFSRLGGCLEVSSASLRS